jgi:porphobilinogen deaminase
MKYTIDEILNPTRHFIKVSQGLIHLEISSQAKILFMVLIGFNNNNSSGVHPSLRYLAKTINVKCKKAVGKHLKELRDNALIEWEQKTMNGANHYYFDLENMVRIRRKRNSKGGEKTTQRGVKTPDYKDITIYRNNIINFKK